MCKAKGTQGEEKAIVAEEKEVADEVLFMTKCRDVEDRKVEWLIDNGRTSHVTSNEDNFLKLNIDFKTQMKIGHEDNFTVW